MKYLLPQTLSFSHHLQIILQSQYDESLCPLSHQFQGDLNASGCTGGASADLDVYRLNVLEPDTTLHITVFNGNYSSLVRLVVAGNIDCVKLSQNAGQAVLFDSGNIIVQNIEYNLEIRTENPSAGPYTITIDSDKPVCMESSNDVGCVNPPLNNPCNLQPGSF